MFRASINEPKSISKPYCPMKYSLISSFFFFLSVAHIYLEKVSYGFEFMRIIKLQIVLGGHAGQTVKETVHKCP